MKRIVWIFVFFILKNLFGDVDIQISGLYLQAHSNGLEHAALEKPYFPFRFGSEIEMRYTSEEGWDMAGLWRHFGSEAKGESLDEQSLYFPSPKLAKITSRWDLELNQVDGEIGRTFWEREDLSIRSHLGISCLHIAQYFSVDHFGKDLEFQIKQNNSFFGAGPCVGIDGAWFFKKHTSWIAELSAAMLWGKFEFRSESQTWSFSDARLSVDARLGIQYDACPWKSSIGFDASLFVDQSHFWRFKPRGVGLRNGNLRLLGISIRSEYIF